VIARPSFYCECGLRWTWVQNADRDEAEYWLKRGEWDMSGGLAEYTFRTKAYMSLWWDTTRVIIGPPKGRHLERAGICGLYAERV
jgi:hypothetical protein